MQEIKTSYGKRKKQEDFKCLSMKETKAKPHMANTKWKPLASEKLNWKQKQKVEVKRRQR